MRVARASHGDIIAQADQPFALTALAFLGLQGVEEVDEMQRDAEELRLASRLGIAVNEPKKLSGEFQALRVRARGLGRPPESAADALQRGRDLVARLSRGKVMVE